MNLKEVTVSYAGTLNLGNYNSAKIGLTVTALAEEGESLEQISDALFSHARGQVRAKALEFFAQRGAQIEEIFAGLPVEVQQQIKGA